MPEQEANKMSTIPTVNMIQTGNKIKTLREQSGLSVKELQTIFGFGTPQAIYKWQRGAAMPTLDNMIVLAAVFRVSIDEIVVTGGM